MNCSEYLCNIQCMKTKYSLTYKGVIHNFESQCRERLVVTGFSLNGGFLAVCRDALNGRHVQWGGHVVLEVGEFIYNQDK